MNTNIMIAALLIAVLLLAAFQAVQIASISGMVTAIAGGSVATTGSGETYEQMMERMHGSGSQQSNPTMVGGC